MNDKVKKFIDENYFSLTLDCKRNIEEIYSAIDDYHQKQLNLLNSCEKLKVKNIKHFEGFVDRNFKLNNGIYKHKESGLILSLEKVTEEYHSLYRYPLITYQLLLVYGLYDELKKYYNLFV